MTWIRNPSMYRKGALALDVVIEKSVVKQSGAPFPAINCLAFLVHLNKQFRYNDGDPISADDQSFIIDNVFNYHPDKAAKMGAGIGHIMVNVFNCHPVLLCCVDRWSDTGFLVSQMPGQLHSRKIPRPCR
ncbi:hypothetical protein JRO89_XS14G0163900 [Xanthoceras sorbifolium]|uniref:Uncharacterized protein n=1 Tax=Xanthoceras sorbifolium TaxID=99658 RepID=A0ABQ8H5E4_9ROSI|nr:hypothetical protein JRO89_XS14G0163900 [Xanthoceras sorbifolium]